VAGERIAYTLDPLQLEAAFEALRKAAETFRPSPRAARLYRWLGRCSTVAVLAFVGMVVTQVAGVLIASLLLLLLFLAASAAAAVLLVVNFSLITGTMRQRWLVKKLGLHTVSRSAWKAERRRNLGGRIRGASLTTVGVILLIFAGLLLIPMAVPQPDATSVGIFELFLIVLLGVPGTTVLIWRMVERSREQLAVVADADRLRALLTSMQAQSGSGASVVVPAEVMEKVARIEKVQIARERAHAVVASVGSADRGYALVVGPEATAQKAALGGAERLAVEELIDDLLAEPHAGTAPGVDDLRHARSADGSTEIDYRVDPSAQRVHVIAVRGLGAVAVGR